MALQRRMLSAGHLGAAGAYPPAKARFVPSTGTFPAGFVAGATATGVKKSGAKDLALVASPAHPCTVAAVFTTNRFCAAPVQVSRCVLAATHGTGLRAVLVNSGCANACTGQRGLDDAWRLARLVDESLGGPPQAAAPPDAAGTLVMSTGVIGQPLQMDKIERGVRSLVGHTGASLASWLAVAEGIMTTDTFPKLLSREFRAPSGATYRMAGWSKGAGMIHPNMATLLSAVFTDASVSKPVLDAAVKFAADRSFNAISIDGDTSTNDTFAVVANGASDAPLIDATIGPDFDAFRDNLTAFAADLAKLIVRDGEGATKFVEIHVKGARSFAEAKTVASTIATSPLVKTAIYGKDANWGRIVCAVGYSGVDVDPSKVNLHFATLSGTYSQHLFKDGAPFDVSEETAAKILEEEDILITVDLGLGSEDARMYTCDFSHEYVSINADYRS
ncbi:Arginine biosynthesis bifunctional protein ArgJ, mitochondrial [Polyrhizophydium stewartii]|uniref:Arginine biosynthesis bifunctional protein ArgJ, mitochondrial n=1 Tax=Polyrhizophydium stewartii TaxID=2732419 RepID=A0ABR4NAA9_9FUNG